MADRKKRNSVHGWLVLDKHAGITSTQAVGAVRRIFNAKKAGHAGTLDPLATGLLPIALGEATKTMSFVVDGKKAYRFTVRWGAETDTDDAEGRITEQSDERSDEFAIRSILPRFTGPISQVPPKYSAIKVDGNRAYDLARSGEAVSLEPRVVTIDELLLDAVPDRDTAIFDAKCGKGTYVRAIARDMGRALGCRGHVIALRRTKVGPFLESQALTLDQLEKMASGDDGRELASSLLPVDVGLAGLPAINLSQTDAGRIARGQPVLIRGRDAPIVSGNAYALVRGQIIAICTIDRGELRPTRVFNWA